jgi:cytochrome c553
MGLSAPSFGCIETYKHASRHFVQGGEQLAGLLAEAAARCAAMVSDRRRSDYFERCAVGVILAVLAGLPVCAQSLQERTPACFACHGEKGQSQLPEVPSLGAQPALYTLIELVMFRDKLRVTEPMNETTKGLSDDDLRAVSDMISKLPPPEPISDTPDSARMDRGRALAQQNRCNFCHQSNFQGLDNVPRLAGQREDYLLKSLRAYKGNTRRGYDAQMSEVVYAMKDEDFVDLAYFLARVK